MGLHWAAMDGVRAALRLCAVALTVLGTIVVRQRPAADGVPSPVMK